MTMLSLSLSKFLPDEQNFLLVWRFLMCSIACLLQWQTSHATDTELKCLLADTHRHRCRHHLRTQSAVSSV